VRPQRCRGPPRLGSHRRLQRLAARRFVKRQRRYGRSPAQTGHGREERNSGHLQRHGVRGQRVAELERDIVRSAGPEIVWTEHATIAPNPEHVGEAPAQQAVTIDAGERAAKGPRKARWGRGLERRGLEQCG